MRVDLVYEIGANIILDHNILLIPVFEIFIQNDNVNNTIYNK